VGYHFYQDKAEAVLITDILQVSAGGFTPTLWSSQVQKNVFISLFAECVVFISIFAEVWCVWFKLFFC